MDAPAFTTMAPVPTTQAAAVGSATCALTPRLRAGAKPAPRRAAARMMADKKENEDQLSESTGYVIKQSEFVDADQEDDMGDGFMGESEMDDMLGVSMPDDLASFEKREIMNAKTRDQLVDKLREIKMRRIDVLEDRRKGMGMDNVDNYLGNL